MRKCGITAARKRAAFVVTAHVRVGGDGFRRRWSAAVQRGVSREMYCYHRVAFSFSSDPYEALCH